MGRKSKRNQIEMPVEVSSAKKLKTAAYVRISDEKEGDSSIHTQISTIHKFIAENAELELSETYVDNGKTGTDFDRKDFQRMMEDIYSGKIECIVVKDLSRFGRNLIECGNYIENIFPKLGIRFIALNDDYDSNIQENRDSLTIPIRNMVNSMYAKDFSRKQVASFELHSRIGDRKIRSIPYGYRLMTDENRMEPAPETAPIVRLIYRWFLLGTGISEIAHRLDEFGIKAPSAYKDGRGEGLWSKNTLYRILSNEAYIGNLVFGKVRSAYYKGIKSHETSREEWFIHENAHEPLVSKEEFEQAAEMRKENAKVVAAKQAGGVSKCTDRFHGKVKCRECGRTMIYFPKYNHAESMTADYKCYNSSRSGDVSTGCEVRIVGQKYNGSLKADGSRRDCGKKVHEAFVRIIALDTIQTLLYSIANMKKAVSGLERKGGAIEKLQSEHMALGQMLAKVKKRIDTLYIDYSSGLISYEDYLEIKEHYVSEEENIGKEILETDSQIWKKRKAVKKFLDWAEKLDMNGLENPELEQKLFDELISEIYISDNLEVEIVFHCSNMLAEINEMLGE